MQSTTWPGKIRKNVSHSKETMSMTRILLCLAVIFVLSSSLSCSKMFREGEYSATDESMPGAPDLARNHDSPNRL